MEALTTEEILALQNNFEGNGDVITPIVVSPFIENLNNFGIEVNSQSDEQSDLKISNFRHSADLSISDPNNKNIWYQAHEDKEKNCSYLLKLENNKPQWNIPCFLPESVQTMCFIKDIIIITLQDNSIFFIDSSFGTPCLPSLVIDGNILYIKVFHPNYLLCITSKKKVIIWSFGENNSLKIELNKEFTCNMPHIKKVQITHELPSGAISPILFFNDYAIRWSESVNHWVLFNSKIPSFFTTDNSQQKTVAALELEFKDALMYCDSQLFMSSYTQLFPIYLRDDRKRAEVLFKQLLKRKGEFNETYCGMKIDEIINTTIEIIQQECPEFLDEIKESKEWKFSQREKVNVVRKSWYIDRPSSMFIGEEEEEPEPEPDFDYQKNRNVVYPVYYQIPRPAVPAYNMETVQSMINELSSKFEKIKEVYNQQIAANAQSPEVIASLNAQFVSQQTIYNQRMKDLNIKYQQAYIGSLDLTTILKMYETADAQTKAFIIQSSPTMQAYYRAISLQQEQKRRAALMAGVPPQGRIDAFFQKQAPQQVPQTPSTPQKPLVVEVQQQQQEQPVGAQDLLESVKKQIIQKSNIQQNILQQQLNQLIRQGVTVEKAQSIINQVALDLRQENQEILDKAQQEFYMKQQLKSQQQQQLSAQQQQQQQILAQQQQQQLAQQQQQQLLAAQQQQQLLLQQQQQQLLLQQQQQQLLAAQQQQQLLLLAQQQQQQLLLAQQQQRQQQQKLIEQQQQKEQQQTEKEEKIEEIPDFDASSVEEMREKLEEWAESERNKFVNELNVRCTNQVNAFIKQANNEQQKNIVISNIQNYFNQQAALYTQRLQEKIQRRCAQFERELSQANAENKEEEKDDEGPLIRLEESEEDDKKEIFEDKPQEEEKEQKEEKEEEEQVSQETNEVPHELNEQNDNSQQENMLKQRLAVVQQQYMQYAQQIMAQQAYLAKQQVILPRANVALLNQQFYVYQQQVNIQMQQLQLSAQAIMRELQEIQNQKAANIPQNVENEKPAEEEKATEKPSESVELDQDDNEPISDELRKHEDYENDKETNSTPVPQKQTVDSQQVQQAPMQMNIQQTIQEQYMNEQRTILSMIQKQIQTKYLSQSPIKTPPASVPTNAIPSPSKPIPVIPSTSKPIPVIASPSKPIPVIASPQVTTQRNNEAQQAADQKKEKVLEILRAQQKTALQKQHKENKKQPTKQAKYVPPPEDPNRRRPTRRPKPRQFSDDELFTKRKNKKNVMITRSSTRNNKNEESLYDEEEDYEEEEEEEEEEEQSNEEEEEENKCMIKIEDDDDEKEEREKSIIKGDIDEKKETKNINCAAKAEPPSKNGNDQKQQKIEVLIPRKHPAKQIKSIAKPPAKKANTKKALRQTTIDFRMFGGLKPKKAETAKNDKKDEEANSKNDDISITLNSPPPPELEPFIDALEEPQLADVDFESIQDPSFANNEEPNSEGMKDKNENNEK